MTGGAQLYSRDAFHKSKWSLVRKHPASHFSTVNQLNMTESETLLQKFYPNFLLYWGQISEEAKTVLQNFALVLDVELDLR